MKLIRVCLIVITILIGSIAHSQHKDFNPFESIGKPGKIVTLSKGKYTEVHINDTLQRIGSVVVNMNTGTIYDILDTDTLYNESNLDPTVITRWYSPDPVVKHNESPYAAMSNNPIWFGDPDGRDTLMMHRQLMPEYTAKDPAVLIWKVTFSTIRNGVEEQVGGVMYMFADKAASEKGYNKLSAPYYTLEFQSMPSHPDFENEIHVFKNIYIHQGNDLVDFEGCLGISLNKPVETKIEGTDKVWVSIEKTVTALRAVNKLYIDMDKLDKLTGDKFLLKNNSTAPAKREPLEAIDPLPKKSIDSIETGPKEIIPMKSNEGN